MFGIDTIPEERNIFSFLTNLFVSHIFWSNPVKILLTLIPIIHVLYALPYTWHYLVWKSQILYKHSLNTFSPKWVLFWCSSFHFAFKVISHVHHSRANFLSTQYVRCVWITFSTFYFRIILSLLIWPNLWRLRFWT